LPAISRMPGQELGDRHPNGDFGKGDHAED
jgi:hypothetical protein